MLTVELISNTDNGIREFLTEGLQSSTHFDWASAYATRSAFSLVSDEFNDFLQRGGRSRAIFDLAQGLTDPEIIEELSTIPGDSECKVYVGEDTTTGIFHHKFYNFYNAENSRMMLGSANFTKAGLTANMESSLAVKYDVDEDLYSSAITFFEESIWSTVGAVSPIGNPQILELYKEIYSKRQKFQSDLNASLELLRRKVTEHYRYTNDFEIFNPFVAYICGIVCANSNYISRDSIDKNRTIRLNFRSQLNNRNLRDEGYICTRINGELLGGIRLEQIPTQIDSMKRLKQRLDVGLSADSENNQITFDDQSSLISTNVKMDLSFGENSQIWNHVRECINQFDTDPNGFFIPSVPEKVLLSDDLELQRRFIAGYFDFRVSPSRGHRLPNGPMRIGLAINTQALSFAEDIMVLLNTLGVTTNFNSGVARGRDHIIRIMPDSESNRLFEKGWKRLLADSYAQFNKSLD